MKTMARQIAPCEIGYTDAHLSAGMAKDTDMTQKPSKNIQFFASSDAKSTAGSTPIDALGSDLLQHVFSFLDGSSAFAAQRVSKTWHAASSSPSAQRLWRSLFLREISPWIGALPSRLGFFHDPNAYPKSYELYGKKQLAPNFWPASEHAFDMVREYLGYSQCNRERGRKLTDILFDYENDINGAVQQFLSRVGVMSDSEAALVARVIFLRLMANGISDKTGVVVIEVDDLGETGVTVLFRLVRELINVVQDHRVVFYSDHNDPRPTFSRAHTHRWTWNNTTGSRFKCSRRKKAITANIPAVVVCNDPQAFLSTPWLPFRQQNLFFVHERSRKGPLPKWLQCLSEITIVS